MSPSPQQIDALIARFTQQFGPGHHPLRAFYAPGRVNLIGEHTDYTGGLVFPCAIDRGTLMLLRQRDDERLRLASTGFDTHYDLARDAQSQPLPDAAWANYPLGGIDALRQAGVALSGADCLFEGNVPQGAGLSSSASIEVVTIRALDALYGAVPLSGERVAQLAQAAENHFVGMQCGIMDQFAASMSRRDHALMLDCRTLDYRHVPLQLGDYTILLSNSNQPHRLTDSAYNDRVRECARALDVLVPASGITHLGALTPDRLDAHAALFADDAIAFRRARHVCQENARVRQAVPLLEAGDLAGFGALMFASHASLKDDYEVTGDAMDTLVDLAREVPGVLGSRITGGGFGGCTVTLLAKTALERFIDEVGSRYQEITGLTADFYTIVPDDGVREIPLQ